MSKDIRAFMIRDDFVTANNQSVSPIYELSESSMTFSKSKDIYYPTEYHTYALWSFGEESKDTLTNNEVNLVTKVFIEFGDWLNSGVTGTNSVIIQSFLNYFNSNNPTTPVTDFTYNQTITHAGEIAPDFVTFSVSDVNISIWVSDDSFQTFYPAYDILVVTPFEDFQSKINSLQQTVGALENFSPVTMTLRMEESKNGYPSTHTKLLNVPYQIPGSNSFRDCYFGFNIYGKQGNYDHVLKLRLYDYLVTDLGLDSTFVTERFPSILEINEFFLVPRWDGISIPSSLGNGSIGSHLTKAFNRPVDVNRYVPIINDSEYFVNNCYNVPLLYNNLMMTTVNGQYSDGDLKDFAEYYSDILTITTTSNDFSRMSERTQRFLTMMENMVRVCDVNSQAELFSKVVANLNYKFTIISRADVTYISIFMEDHQYYMIPRYEYTRLI